MQLCTFQLLTSQSESKLYLEKISAWTITVGHNQASSVPAGPSVALKPVSLMEGRRYSVISDCSLVRLSLGIGFVASGFPICPGIVSVFNLKSITVLNKIALSTLPLTSSCGDHNHALF